MEWMIPKYLEDIGRPNDSVSHNLIRGFVDHYFQRMIPIGFPPTSLSAGSTARLVVRPCLEMDEFLDSRVLSIKDPFGDFQLWDLRVGKNSAFLASTPVPAAAFTTACNSPMRFLNIVAPKIRPHMDVHIEVRNTNASARTLEAVIWVVKNPLANLVSSLPLDETGGEAPEASASDRPFVTSSSSAGAESCYGCGKILTPTTIAGSRLCIACKAD